MFFLSVSTEISLQSYLNEELNLNVELKHNTHKHKVAVTKLHTNSDQYRSSIQNMLYPTILFLLTQCNPNSQQ